MESGSTGCCWRSVSERFCLFRRLQEVRRGRRGGAASSRRWMSRACALFRFLRMVELECCANLHRRTQGGDVCGMGSPVRHIVFRLSWFERCVAQLRALRLRAGVDCGGARGVCFRGRCCLVRVGSSSLGCAMALRLIHVRWWCVMMSMSSFLYSFCLSLTGTLSQSCVSETSISPWIRERLMGLDGGASKAVVRLCGVSCSVCWSASPRRGGGGDGVVLHRA